MTISEAGAAAVAAEARKQRKYSSLSHDYVFQPLAFETLGCAGPSTLTFLRALGMSVRRATNEKRSGCYLLQRIGVAIQRGNAAAVRGTIQDGEDLEEVFYL
jgi:hypothetical protein